MTMKMGWRAEVAYATSVLAATDDYVYHFGDNDEKHEIPLPWHETTLTPVRRLGQTAPVDLIEGMRNVEFPLKFYPLSADELKYLLGTVTAGTTFTPSTTLPSRTCYFEMDNGDVVIVTGCVTKSADLYFDKLLPTEFQINVLGSICAEHGALAPSSGSSPRYHADLDITSAWGWGDRDETKLDTTDIIGDDGEINRIHVHVENLLLPRTSDKIIEIKKVGYALSVDFEIPAKNKNNLIVQAVRTDDTNDLYYKWERGTSTWELWVNNMKLRSQKVTVQVGDATWPVYVIAGQAYYSSANTGFEDAIKFKAVDGVTYS